MKSFALALMLLFFVPVIASAQDNANTTNTTQEVGKAKTGTYQIVITETKNIPVFTDELLYTIEQNRDENETKYLDLGTGVRVTIPSRREISEPGFVPLEEIVYQ